MQGLFVRGFRPRSKQVVKEAIAETPELVYIEATSLFDNEYDGEADELPVGQEVHFVGPDPHKDRRFYGTIRSTLEGIKVS